MVKRLTKLLPQTDSRLLTFVLVGFAIAGVWYAVQGFGLVLTGEPVRGILALLWLPITVGLWRLRQMGRWVALVILWSMVFMVPYGELSIWTLINAAAPPGPIWEPLIFRVAPFAIPAAFAIELLYAYRSEFKSNRVSALAAPRSSGPQLPRSWTLWSLAVIGTPATIVALLCLDLEIKGTCIPMLAPANGPYGLFDPLWTILPLACAAVGLLAFLRAAPVEASRRNRVVRAILYAAAMFLFYSEVAGYIRYERFC